jgi:hypothetical protein
MRRWSETGRLSPGRSLAEPDCQVHFPSRHATHGRGETGAEKRHDGKRSRPTIIPARAWPTALCSLSLVSFSPAIRVFVVALLRLVGGRRTLITWRPPFCVSFPTRCKPRRTRHRSSERGELQFPRQYRGRQKAWLKIRFRPCRPRPLQLIWLRRQGCRVRRFHLPPGLLGQARANGGGEQRVGAGRAPIADPSPA